MPVYPGAFSDPRRTPGGLEGLDGVDRLRTHLSAQDNGDRNISQDLLFTLDLSNWSKGSGDDTFYATQRGTNKYALLSGTGFYNRAKFFEEVYADLGQGGDDQADMYDSSGDDLLEADDGWTRLSNAAAGWLYEIQNLNSLDDIVRAHSQPGDDDDEQIDWPDLLFTLDLSDWD